jgi:dipeptidyl aminopeptidase/acylaminoacyl peptidase
MLLSRKFLLLVILMMASGNILAQQATDNSAEKPKPEEPKFWTPEQMMKVQRIGAVRPSPDGRQAAFVVTEAVMTAEKSEYLNHIHLATIAGGNDKVGGETTSRQITFGEKSATQPVFSPDGKRLAFLSNRSGKNQIYVLHLDGGEGEPITDMKADIASLAWAPDGKSIAFLMPDPKPEDDEKKTKGKDDSRFFEEQISHVRLYIVPVEKDKNSKREARKLTSDARTVQAFDFAPDGRSIVFSHVKSPKVDHWPTADLSIVDLTSGQVRILANTAAAENTPHFSPDGKTIAFVMSDNPPRWAQNNRIALISSAGGTPKWLPESVDGNPALHGWSQDGAQIFYSEPRGTLTSLYAQSAAGGAAAEIPIGGGTASNFSLNATGTNIGFSSEFHDRAAEAFISPLNNVPPKRISNVNVNLPSHPLPKTETIKWKAADGRDIEGILIYPIGYKPGSKVPLLLNVHGGPAGVFVQHYSAAPVIYPLAVFASKGFAILRPNPRGSTGYGVAFRRANEKDWGGADYQDLMRGVDKVIELGIADPQRMGVMGWSYGGFMSAWIITQTNRFKAASIGAPVVNLMSFNGTADIPAFVPDYFGGQSWEIPEVYSKFGAMMHIGKAKTPSLIQHNEGDIRVPISQGYELFNALKQRGVEARMLVVPRQAHGPTEPKALLKLMETNVSWFEEKLKPDQTASKDVERRSSERPLSLDPSPARGEGGRASLP